MQERGKVGVGRAKSILNALSTKCVLLAQQQWEPCSHFLAMVHLKKERDIFHTGRTWHGGTLCSHLAAIFPREMERWPKEIFGPEIVDMLPLILPFKINKYMNR